MGKEAEKFHRRLAALISEKRMTPFSYSMSHLRGKLSFCLLRTVLAALRGYRGQPAKTDDCNKDINLLHLNEIVRYCKLTLFALSWSLWTHFVFGPCQSNFYHARICSKLEPFSRVAKRQTAHSTLKGLGNFLALEP